MGEANAPRKMAREIKKEKKSAKDKWICLLKMSEVKMREMPKSAADLNRSTNKSERKREKVWKKRTIDSKREINVHVKREQFAAKCHLSTFSKCLSYRFAVCFSHRANL